MKPISVRLLLPGLAVMALTPHQHVLNDVVADWNIQRERKGEKRVLGSVVVGSVELPTQFGDKGRRIQMFAELRADIGYDHGAIYNNPEAARDELAALATAFDAELARQSLAGVIGGEIAHGLCVWPRDVAGVLGEMKTAA